MKTIKTSVTKNNKETYQNKDTHLERILDLTEIRIQITQEINETFETLVNSLKSYMGDKFETKLETYIFDRRYVQVMYAIGHEMLSKSYFIHKDLYARTSLSNRSVDRYINYMLKIEWIKEIPNPGDRRVKKYIWYPDPGVSRILEKAEYDEQIAQKKFSEIIDEMPLMPDLEYLVNKKIKTDKNK